MRDERPDPHWRGLAGVAALLVPILVFHTGIYKLAQVWGAPVPLLVFLTYFKEVLFAGLVAGVAYHALRGRVRVLPRYLPAVAGWAVFGLYLVCLALADGASAASWYAMRVYTEPLVAGGAMGIALAYARRGRRLWQYIVACVVPVAVGALLQVLFPFSALASALRKTSADAYGELPPALSVSIVNQFRPFSSFGDPNDLALYGAIAFLATFAPVPDGPRWRRWRAWGRGAGLVIVLLAFSRSGLLALAAGLAVWTALYAWFEPVRARIVTWRRAGALALTVVAVAALLVAFGSRIPQVQHLINTVNRLDPSARGHAASLQEGIQFSAAHPVGVGLGAVGPRARTERTYHVESSYVMMAMEAGVAGLAIYALAMLATLLPVLLDATLRAGRPERRDWARAVLGLLVAQAASFAFLPNIVSLQTGALVWASVGVLAVSTDPEVVRGTVPPGADA